MNTLDVSSTPSPSRNTREAVLRYQDRQFRQLLRHIWAHSAFYRDFYHSHGIHETDLDELSIGDLPFTTKQVLMDNFDTVVTDTRLRQEALDSWLEINHQPSDNFLKDFIVLHSSGSSGTIGITVYHRRDLLMIGSIASKYFPPLRHNDSGKIKAAYCVAERGHIASASMASRLPATHYDVVILPVLEDEVRAVENLNQFQPHRVMTYASVMEQLADSALRGQLCIAPEHLFVSGDLLTEARREKIKMAWDVPLFNIYSASESLYIAISGPDEGHMTVIDELNIVEMLDDNNKPVGPNEQGRVVLTNLCNTALPMVRYELGDYVLKGDTSAGQAATMIQNIQGRAAEALPVLMDDGMDDGNAGEIHFIALTAFYTSGLQKMQFISYRPDHLRVDYVANRPLDEWIRREFQRFLERRRSGRTTFDVRKVEHIPNDPHSGKFKFVRFEDQDSVSVRDSGKREAEKTRGRGSGVARERGSKGARFSSIHNRQSAIRNRKIRNQDRCFHHLFEAQAAKTPDQTAVVYEGASLTYRVLDIRANQLAHYLRRLGVKPDTSVGMYVERSLDMMVGIMGILKAGGAYLPIDPIFPAERAGFMLEDTQATVLLTQGHLTPKLPDLPPQLQVVTLDTDWKTIARESEEPPPDMSNPSDLMYVVFTSGSTGKSKGVAIEHRHLVNYVNGITERLNFPSGAGFANVSSYAMDTGHTTIFPALCTGGCLHVISRERALDADALAAYFSEHPIDCMKIVSSHMAALLRSGRAGLVALRWLVLGGEVCHWALVERIQQLNPECMIFNHYGPAETTVGCMTFRVGKRTDAPESVTVPIGQSLPNQQVYILDEHLQSVPVGSPGEVYIGGAGVGRGYLNRPELTASRFIPDPISGVPGARLYRTGDLGCYHATGDIEFLRRIDNQVKIRGFRVELAEVENALRKLPAVREAVVIAYEFAPNDNRLFGYIVPHSGQREFIPSVREQLSPKLPDYMIPSAIAVLDAFPLDPNGKVNRRALPPPAEITSELETSFVAPRTAVEETLAEIWSDLLGQEEIGIFHNFLDLGGHSLLVTQLVARVRETFEIEFPLDQFFETPTVAAMAESVEERLIEKIDALSDEEVQQLL